MNNRIYLIALTWLFSACQPQSPVNEDSKTIERYYNRITFLRNTENDSVMTYANLIQPLKAARPEEAAMKAIAQGQSLQRISQPALALQLYNQADTLLGKSTADSLRVRALIGRGHCLRNMSDFPQATASFLDALRIAEKTGNRQDQASAHSGLAQAYQIQDKADLSEKHLKLAMDLLDKQTYTSTYLIAAHTLANLYGMSGKFNEALALDNRCIAICDSVKQPLLKSPFLDNKANCFIMLEKIDSAHLYFRASYLIDSTAGSKRQMADTYNNMGALYVLEKKFTEAEASVAKGIALCRETSYKQGLMYGFQSLSDVYQAQEKWKDVADVKDSIAKYQKQILNEKTENQTVALNAFYENEKKEKQLLVKDNELKAKNNLLISIVFGGLILLVASFVYYRRNRRRREQELNAALRRQDELSTQAVFETEQKERLRIARDLHDSVGQMLSVVKMQVSSIHEKTNEDSKPLTTGTMELVDKTIREVRGISHNLLPEELRFGLIPALEELADQTNIAGQTHIAIDAAEAMRQLNLSETRTLSIYRIVQEIVANMLRHAQATRIVIRITQVADELAVQVIDNGKGFDETLLNNSNGIGWKNIAARTQLLNGRMHVHSAADGTKITLQIPR